MSEQFCAILQLRQHICLDPQADIFVSQRNVKIKIIIFFQRVKEEADSAGRFVHQPLLSQIDRDWKLLKTDSARRHHKLHQHLHNIIIRRIISLIIIKIIIIAKISDNVITLRIVNGGDFMVRGTSFNQIKNSSLQFLPWRRSFAYSIYVNLSWFYILRYKQKGIIPAKYVES